MHAQCVGDPCSQLSWPSQGCAQPIIISSGNSNKSWKSLLPILLLLLADDGCGFGGGLGGLGCGGSCGGYGGGCGYGGGYGFGGDYGGCGYNIPIPYPIAIPTTYSI